MGLWSFICSVGSSIKSAAGRVVEAVGSVIPGRLGDKIEEIGWNMQYPSSHYDSGTATVSETVDITAECKKACEEATDQAEPVINEIINEGKKMLREVWDDVSKNVPVEERDATIVATCFSGLKQEYRDFIAQKISLNNEDFLKAVKIVNRAKREQAIQQYVKTVFQSVSQFILNRANTEKDRAVQKMLAILENHLKSQEEEIQLREEALRGLEENQDNAESIVRNLTNQIVNISYLKCIRSIARSKLE